MKADAERRGSRFLAIPPFPNSRLATFEERPDPAEIMDDQQADEILDLLAKARVGGSYWGARPHLGQGRYRLVRDRGPKPNIDLPDEGQPVVRWLDQAPAVRPQQALLALGDCDPWHMLAHASELVCRKDDTDMQLLAELSEVPVRFLDELGKPASRISRQQLLNMLRHRVAYRRYLDPFTKRPFPLREVLKLCAFWRGLVDSNRDLAAVYGFAGWKQATTAPLLWGGGSTGALFDRPVAELPPGSPVALWRSRVSPSRLEELKQRGALLVEVEDGFIRSSGLGANCVPPQSILVDRLGVHFDARTASDLERLLEEADLPEETLRRAEAVRSRIVALGLSKYDLGQEPLQRRADRPHILVPGQVEDDRAVLSAIGGALMNRELLRKVREAAPDAYIIYKPHPDVEAGHRRGGMADSDTLALADEVVRKPSISSWIDLVDEVHVNSSLAGFEALLRGKAVTTHGVPFYAGWGLTRDLGPVPARRTRRRSLSELVAVCLLLYPRYVDPVTNLPCPLEVLIEKLSEPGAKVRPAPLVAIRRMQGWLRRLPLLLKSGGR